MYTCTECHATVGFNADPYRCHRTGRTAQPHQPAAARRTPPPPAHQLDHRPDRSHRAKPRHRRKAAPAADWPDGVSFPLSRSAYDGVGAALVDLPAAPTPSPLGPPPPYLRLGHSWA
jgi:hypothetical protein